MRKKGFTFAELMISLVIISVVAAVLYPTIAHYTPNTNKPLFKSAYKTLSSALSEITTRSYDGTIVTIPDPIPAGGITDSGKILCSAFCDVVNVVPEPDGAGGVTTNCGIAANQICNDGVLTTTNGMRWLFSNYVVARNKYELLAGQTVDSFLIEVDVNSSNNNLTGNNYCGATASLSVTADSKGLFCFNNTENATTGLYLTLPTPVANPVYNANSLKSQDTFQILVDNTGHIQSISPAGWADLEDVMAD